MKTITFTTAAEFNSFADSIENGAKITNVNGVECSTLYPIFETRSTKHVSYYNAEKQCNDYVEGPFTVTILE